MKRLKAFCVGMAASEGLLVGAFLDLVALTDGHVFGLADSLEDADIVVFNPLSADGAAWITRDHTKHHARIAYVDEDIATAAGLWQVKRPIRLAPLREVLIQAVDFLRAKAQLAAPGKPPAEVTRPAEKPNIEPHRRLEHFVDLVTRTFKDRIPQNLIGVAGVEFLMLPESASIAIKASPEASWQSALRLNRRAMTTMSRMGAKAPADCQTVSLDKFLWEGAKQLSGGMLLPGIAHLQTFGLTRWPDFGALSVGANDMKLAALLVGRPSTIEQISNLIKLPHAELVGFLNACALVGCMRYAPANLTAPTAEITSAPSMQATAQPTPAATPPQRGFVGLLGKLRAALNFSPRASA